MPLQMLEEVEGRLRRRAACQVRRECAAKVEEANQRGQSIETRWNQIIDNIYDKYFGRLGKC